MNPWNIDANSIQLDDIKAQDLDVLMVMTPEIRDFLRSDSNKRFIVAPKGFGKTYLLKVKSQLFRDSAKGYKFLPGKQLCERFVDLNIRLSSEDVTKFNDLEAWKKLWKLCLYTLIIAIYQPDALPATVRDIIKNSNTLCDILSCFLLNRKKVDRFLKNELVVLSRLVQDLNEDAGVTQLAIFVDNIDEALESYVGVNKKDISEDVWVNAQLGLLLVSNELCSRNSHIKFYMTIRSEAYNKYEGALKMQLDGLCVFLQYNKAQLRDIFIKNIRRMDRQELIKPNAADPIEAFIGHREINHRFIVDDQDQPAREDIFEFIYRHTYKRPREIVKMGAHIAGLNGEERTDFKALIDRVNEVSSSLFVQYEKEIIPSFREDLFEALCNKVGSNIVRFEDAQHIAREIRTDEDDVSVFEYFHKLGLIGIVENEVNGQMVQKFLNVGEYTLTKLRKKMVKYYVIHPSLNEYFKSYIGFYDKYNIIGYDLPLNMEQKRKQEIHVHFGLDRDSLTLLLPELARVKSLAVVAPPSNEWRDLEQAGTLVVSVNGSAYSFRVLTDLTPDDEKEQLFKGWMKKDYFVLIYSSDKELIRQYLLAAQVMSCCNLTPAIEEVLVDMLPVIPLQEQPYFYLCFREYIEERFDAMDDFIRNLNKALIVTPVLIDKYQYACELTLDAGERTLRYEIAAEEYGSIICFDKKNAILKASSVINRIRSQAEFNFYRSRQNLLVESLYQLYRLLQHDGVMDEYEVNGIIDKFISIQIRRLISGITPEDFKKVFPNNTKAETEQILRRFAAESRQRIVRLLHHTAVSLSDRATHVPVNKERLLFPHDHDLYRLMTVGRDFYERTAQAGLLKLCHLLETKSLPGQRSWFISYSTKDIVSAEIIHARLTLMGCKAVIYCKEIVAGAIRNFELANVTGNDRMIFLASQHSLKSEACHRELSECFAQMRRNNDSSKLLIVALDDYIFNANLNDFWEDTRRNNIEFIRNRINVIDFRSFFDKENLKELHDTLETINRS